MRRTPFSVGLIYAVFGTLLTIMAINTVSSSGWGFFAYTLVLLATLEFGSAIRLFILHWKIKSMNKKK